jgi:hypothetical protein
VLIAIVTSSACSSTDAGGDTGSGAPTPSATTSESPSAAPSESAPASEKSTLSTVEVRISGDSVTPNAEQLELARGEAMVFDISSDRAGELHIHSRPEQYVEFSEGRTRAEISIDTPGSVKVEEHDTSKVVAILEVR